MWANTFSQLALRAPPSRTVNGPEPDARGFDPKRVSLVRWPWRALRGPFHFPGKGPGGAHEGEEQLESLWLWPRMASPSGGPNKLVIVIAAMQSSGGGKMRDSCGNGTVNLTWPGLWPGFWTELGLAWQRCNWARSRSWIGWPALRACRCGKSEQAHAGSLLFSLSLSLSRW